MQRSVFALLLLIALCVALPATAHAQAAWDVSASGSDILGNGSPSSPFATVQHAVDQAASGDIVFVGPGTFAGNVTMKNGVSLHGSGAGVTTLTAGGSGSVITATNIGSTTRVEDFSITGGFAALGAGINCSHSSLVIQDNTITGNSAVNGGGGIYCYASTPEIIDNTITDNHAPDGSGGGIFCDVSPAEIFLDRITANSTGGAGGGIYVYNSNPSIILDTITGNAAGHDGGGVACFNSPSNIIDDVISNNTAGEDGGGICSMGIPPAITNDVISDNTAGQNGGGVDLQSSASAITNDTITGNSAIAGGGIYNGSGGTSPAITNCILWSNGDDLANCSATYSDVSDGDAGTGNISAGPSFVSTATQNFRLLPGSPCIDEATATGAPPVDPDGVRRPQGSGYDMGAYEWVAPHPAITPVTLHGETSVDCTIDGLWVRDSYVPVLPVGGVTSATAGPGGTVHVVVDPSFSGAITLPVAIAHVNGTTETVDADITVEPGNPYDVTFGPSSPHGSTVRWAGAPNAHGYRVYVGGKLIGTTGPAVASLTLSRGVLLAKVGSSSAVVDGLLGPNANVQVQAVGNSGTLSDRIAGAYKSVSAVGIGTVAFGPNSAVLSSAAKRTLNKMSLLVKAQGFGTIYVSGWTAHSSEGSAAFRKRLSIARASAIRSYLLGRFKALHVNVAVVALGNGAVPGSPNGSAPDRKGVIAVW